jgi:hypothetical protein
MFVILVKTYNLKTKTQSPNLPSERRGREECSLDVSREERKSLIGDTT